MATTPPPTNVAARKGRIALGTKPEASATPGAAPSQAERERAFLEAGSTSAPAAANGARSKSLATSAEGKGISFLSRPAELYDWLQDVVHLRKKKGMQFPRQKDVLRVALLEWLIANHPELMPEGFDVEVIRNPPED